MTLTRPIATISRGTDDPVLIAYPHDTGAGLTVLLDAVPVDGRIILLERDDADDARLLREAMRRQK